MATTFKTTEDGCIEIVVTKDGFTEVGWVSSMHLVYGKEKQLLEVIERKASVVFAEISELERQAMTNPIHDA